MFQPYEVASIGLVLYIGFGREFDFIQQEAVAIVFSKHHTIFHLGELGIIQSYHKISTVKAEHVFRPETVHIIPLASRVSQVIMYR